MSTPLQIKPDTAEILADQAEARGLSVDEYLRTLLGVGSDTERAAAPRSTISWQRWNRSLKKTLSLFLAISAAKTLTFPKVNGPSGRHECLSSTSSQKWRVVIGRDSR